MNIKINIVELASELAHKELSKTSDHDLDYENDVNIYVEDENGDTRYTEKAQDEFNGLYDKYWDVIIETIVYPFKEGDDYYTIENNKIVWSCWDCSSEEFYRDEPNRLLFKTKEQAQEHIDKLNK